MFRKGYYGRARALKACFAGTVPCGKCPSGSGHKVLLEDLSQSPGGIEYGDFPATVENRHWRRDETKLKHEIEAELFYISPPQSNA